MIRILLDRSSSRCLRIISCILLLLLASSTMADEKTPPLAELLPANAALYIGVDSGASLSEKANRTDFAKILEMDGVKQFVEQVQARSKDSTSSSMALSSSLQLLGEGKGQSSLAVVEKEKSFAALALLIEVKDDAAKFTGLLSAHQAKLQSQGFSARTLPAGSPVIAFEKTSDAKIRTLHCWFQTPKLVCMANDLELAESILARLADPSKGESLAANALFRETIANCKDIAAPDLWIYAIPTSIAQLSQTDPDDKIEPKEILAKHGFDNLQAIAMTIEMARGDFELEYDLFVKAPKPFAKAMQMLQFESSSDLDPPAWLSDDLNNVLRMEWNVKDLLKHSAGPIDEVMEKEGFLQTMLDDLKSDVGPGVDLQTELFDYLAPPVLIIGRSDEVVSAGSEHTLVAVKVTDEAKVASAIRRLLVNDETAAKVPVIPASLELWRLGSTKPVGASGAGVRFKSSGIMVLGGYLLMSSNVEGIKRMLESRNAGKPPLADSAEYQRGKLKFGPSAQEKGIFRVYFSMSRDMRTSYELLRMGQVETAESIYAQFLAPFVAADRKSGKSYDFSKLPEFKKIQPLLGTAFAHGVETEQGWKLRGIILKNALPPAPK